MFRFRSAFFVPRCPLAAAIGFRCVSGCRGCRRMLFRKKVCYASDRAKAFFISQLALNSTLESAASVRARA